LKPQPSFFDDLKYKAEITELEALAILMKLKNYIISNVSNIFQPG